MKKKVPKRILKEFQNDINNTIYDFSDCSICAICCKDETVILIEPDINRISRRLKIDKKTFLNQYTHKNIDSNETVMNMPCPFLKKNRCKIYSIRPVTCRNFPVYVHQNGVISVSNIEECAKATHFNELFLDYCSKYHLEYFKTFSEDIDTKPPNDSSVKFAFLPIRYVALFIMWLNSSEDK